MGTKISYIVDRRRAPRQEVKLPIELRRVGTEENFLVEYAHNISRTGIFLQTPAPVEVGTQMELVFRLPEEEARKLGHKTLRLMGKVVWVNQKGGKDCPNPGMGVQFDAIEEATLELLEHVVARVAVLPEKAK